VVCGFYFARQASLAWTERNKFDDFGPLCGNFAAFIEETDYDSCDFIGGEWHQIVACFSEKVPQAVL
jgi:hypothetical protein